MDLAKKLNFDGRPFIEGAFHKPNASERLTLVYPGDNEQTGAFAIADGVDVDLAVQSARRAFDDGRWSRQPPRVRKAALSALASLIERDRDYFAAADCLDMGKPISAGAFEVNIAAGFFRFYAEAIDKAFSGQTVPAAPGSFEMQVRRPRGVVAAIIPWNFPTINAAMKLSQILAAGNTVVLKPSELAPRSAEHIAKLAIEAGFPPGVLNVVQGPGSTGDTLARHRDVDLIAFTGSTATGKALMRAVGESTLKPVMLECGGKSPEIVFDDFDEADLDGIAQNIIGGAFMNSGQVCVARTRLYVQSGIYDKLVQRVAAAAQHMAPGEPTNPQTRMGPLASLRQKQTVERFVAGGLRDGGTLLADGRKPAAGKGCYFGATVFTGLDPKSELVQEEIFGPVLAVAKFDRDEDGVRLANDTRYGLAATIWTRDLKRAHEIPALLEAGMIKVMASPAQTEGTGFAHAGEPAKQSGFGAEGGMKAFESFSRLQSVEMSFG